MLRLGSLALLAAMAGATGAAGQVPPDLRAALGRTAVQPADATYKSLHALPPARRSSVLVDLIRRTWSERCPGAAVKNTQLARDGRSMWSVKCGEAHIAFTVVLPSHPDGRAQVLKCRPD